MLFDEFALICTYSVISVLQSFVCQTANQFHENCLFIFGGMISCHSGPEVALICNGSSYHYRNARTDGHMAHWTWEIYCRNHRTCRLLRAHCMRSHLVAQRVWQCPQHICTALWWSMKSESRRYFLHLFLTQCQSNPVPRWVANQVGRNATCWCVHCHVVTRYLPPWHHPQEGIKCCNGKEWALTSTWQAEYGDIPANYFVWLDKSSVDDCTNQHMDGWAVSGHACVHCTMFIRGQQYSVLPAFTSEGYIALDIFEGSVNKERFICFLEDQLVCVQDTIPLAITHKYCRPRNSPLIPDRRVL